MQTCHLLLTVSGIYTVRRCVVAAVCRIETKPHTHLLRKRAGDTVHQEYYVRFRTRCLPMCVYCTSAPARAPRTGCQREPLSHCFTGKFLLLHSFSVLLIFYLTRCRFVAPSGVCSVDCFSIFAGFFIRFLPVAGTADVYESCSIVPVATFVTDCFACTGRYWRLIKFSTVTQLPEFTVSSFFLVHVMWFPLFCWCHGAVALLWDGSAWKGLVVVTQCGHVACRRLALFTKLHEYHVCTTGQWVTISFLSVREIYCSLETKLNLSTKFHFEIDAQVTAVWNPELSPTLYDAAIFQCKFIYLHGN